MSNPVLMVHKDADGSGVSYWMWCPACDDAVRINGGWVWDGNIESPTFSPSILTHKGPESDRSTCHSFVRAGQWEYLSDCTHSLAGQTVPMVPVPDWMADDE